MQHSLPLRCILVVAERDRPRLDPVLRGHSSNIIVLAVTDDTAVAHERIVRHEPDLVLYDPRVDDGALLVQWERTYGHVPILLCVSDDPSYAVQAFEAGAVHYVVGGADVASFDLAFERVRRRYDRMAFRLAQTMRDPSTAYGANIIALPVLDGMEVRRRDDIIRIQGERNYSTVIFARDPALMLSRPLGDYAAVLGDAGFVRVHRSHIVNLTHVRRVVRGKGAHLIMSNGDVVVVSDSYRDDLFARLSVPGRRRVREE